MTNPSILLVDDDPASVKLMSLILSEVGEVRVATSVEDALRLARESTPDLVLLDLEMPGMRDLQVLEALKREADLAEVPVILVTGHSDAMFETASFEKGAADFIAKPVSPPLVLARVRTQLHLKRMADELRDLAAIDRLTGIANRRHFHEMLEREWRRARRHGDPMALLMIDIDHFRAFNDRYGQQAGDACLRSVTQALVGVSLRPPDLVARFGAGEFTVLLPATPRGGAEHVANAVLEAIEALGIPHDASPTGRHVTVSVGVACYDDSSDCWMPPSVDNRFAHEMRNRCVATDLLRVAEKAVGDAKDSGRAHARLLDIADANTRQVGREVAKRIQPSHPDRAAAPA